MDYLTARWNATNSRVGPCPSWKLKICATPLQSNGKDCGVFTMKVMDCIALGIPVSFDPKCSSTVRKRIALQILDNSMLQSY